MENLELNNLYRRNIMTEEQIEWLKENLSIYVDGNNEADYRDVIVTLTLNGEEISRGSVRFWE